MAEKFIHHFWRELFLQNIQPTKDPVSYLQELVQAKFKQVPQYYFVQSGGCDHLPIFTAKLIIEPANIAISQSGKSNCIRAIYFQIICKKLQK